MNTQQKNKFRNLISDKVAILLLTMFFVIIAIMSATLWKLHEKLTKTMAAQNTFLFSRAITEFRTIYTSEVIEKIKLKPHGFKISHDYENQSDTIPIPAAFTRELGAKIIEHFPGAQFRLYSDNPFPWRQGKGEQDEFERTALIRLRKNPEIPYFQFQNYRGQESIRYAVADRMRESCVKCHNEHPDSPKRDWQVGDMRGVVEIIFPLHTAPLVEVRKNFKNAYLASIIVGLLGLIGIGIVIAKLRNDKEISRTIELKLGTILNAIADGIIVINEDNVIEMVNSAVTKIWGYTEEELIGQDLTLLMPEKYKKRHKDGLRRYLKGGKPHIPWNNIEFEGMKKDGSVFPLELNFAETIISKGKIFIGAVRVISESRKIEKLYRNAIAQIEGVPYKVNYLTQKIGTEEFEFIGQGIEKLTGIKEQNFNRKIWRELIIKSEIQGRDTGTERIETIYQTRDNKRAKWREDIQIRTPTGEVRWIEDSSIQLCDNSGKVYGALGILQDITYRKLVESRLNLRTRALESAANGIMITDNEGKITWVNPAFTKLSGYAAEEAKGKNPNISKSGKHDKSFYEDLWRTIMSGKVWRGETTNRKKDGSMYILEQTITPVTGDNGEIINFISIMQDITELKEARKKAAEAERINTASVLAAQFAHRLTNISGTIPLVIKGIKERIAINDLDDLELDQRLKDLESDVKRLLKMAEQLNIPQKFGQIKTIKIASVIADAIDTLSHRVSTIKIEFNPGESDYEKYRVKGVENILVDIFINLIQNAVEANSKKIKFSTSVSMKTRELVVKVQDDGDGIKQPDLEKIFIPLYSKKIPAEKDAMRGLGLWVSREMIAKIGGRMTVESSLGEGSVFSVILPLADSENS